MMTKGYLWILALVTAFCLTGCTQEDALDGGKTADSQDKVEITFSLHIDNAAATRASEAGDSQNQGTDASHSATTRTARENMIDNLQVFLFDTNNDCKGKFTQIGELGSDASYYGWMDKTQAGLGDDNVFTGKIVVLANCPEVTEEKPSMAELAAKVYTYESSFTTNLLATTQTAYIPMWGVISPNKTLTPGVYTDLGDIDLLRAMAKINLKMSEKAIADGYTLQSATLSTYNTTGCVVPTGYDVTATALVDNDKAMNIPSGVQTGQNLSFVDGVLYLPEFKHSESNHADITVKVGEKEYTFQMLKSDSYKDTDTGDFEDLVRNHIYNYTLDVDNGKVLVEPQVNPWWKVDSEVSWDVSDALFLAWEPEEKNGKWQYTNYINDATKGDDEATLCWVAKPRWNKNRDGVVETGNSSSAQFLFQLQKPTGVVWKAYLTDTKNFIFNYSVVKDYTVERKCASTGIARELPYCIKVDAANDLKDTKKDGTLTTTDRYTDLYIIAQYADGRYEPVTINPKVSGLKTFWKDDRRFAGGTTTQTVYIDDDKSKPVTLKPGQWIRIWQTEAILPKKPSDFNAVAKLLSDAQPKGYQYWKGN